MELRLLKQGVVKMESKCKKCGEMVTGEDLGDHPAWLTFICECGAYWSENRGADLQDRAMEQYKYRGVA